MQRWQLTLALTTTALGAAILAPRLLGSVPAETSFEEVAPPPQEPLRPRHVKVEVPQRPVAVAPPPIAEVEPVRPAARLRPVKPSQLVIPEMASEPALDEFWLDMVDCGMG